MWSSEVNIDGLIGVCWVFFFFFFFVLSFRAAGMWARRSSVARRGRLFEGFPDCLFRMISDIGDMMLYDTIFSYSGRGG